VRNPVKLRQGLLLHLATSRKPESLYRKRQYR